jgi:hypothetical protein
MCRKGKDSTGIVMTKSNVSRTSVGGGIKKVLYTLKKVGTIGLGKATKALVSNNTCKACGLGIGGATRGDD